MSRAEGLALYTTTARTSSRRIIQAYSTSFGLASRLLPRDVRQGIADVYALVRVADEIVDGPAVEAGLDPGTTRSILDELEQETIAAIARGFSANLVVHAFAVTARQTGITAELLRPFFASMRMDLDPVEYDRETFRRYIHGSAEVVGSMCLRVFASESPGTPIDDHLEEGARRLGAAFQKVNFLRDLADDVDSLGRQYIPGTRGGRLTEADKNAMVDEIDDDLTAARSAIRRLPPGSRRATAAAAALFGRLNEQLRTTPVEQLRRRRVSVPTSVKLRLVSGAALGRVIG
ncbi:phytoene/squalene synthase family protein [Microbacterium sp. NPDC057659]|uniref:phytoene/squalene synthase family protein n=1 Tax=Microbacterium sp. NPDC057659 TaxID=3346198 RepID=UPI00366EBE4D